MSSYGPEFIFLIRISFFARVADNAICCCRVTIRHINGPCPPYRYAMTLAHPIGRINLSITLLYEDDCSFQYRVGMIWMLSTFRRRNMREPVLLSSEVSCSLPDPSKLIRHIWHISGMIHCRDIFAIRWVFTSVTCSPSPISVRATSLSPLMWIAEDIINLLPPAERHILPFVIRSPPMKIWRCFFGYKLWCAAFKRKTYTADPPLRPFLLKLIAQSLAMRDSYRYYYGWRNLYSCIRFPERGSY